MIAYERRQLVLPFPHEPGYDGQDFLSDGSNAAALAWLNRTADWPDRRLALWGPAGCGKTHLLHLWAGQADAVRLAGQTLRDLDGLPDGGAMTLDDADTVQDETLLLHLLNTARDRGLFVLLSGRTAPARWPIRLPDLSSRLRAITAVEIEAPGDDLLRALLFRLLADRQLKMGDAVREWLLVQLPRSAGALREAVARLDRESMLTKQPITRALAGRVLEMQDHAIAGANEIYMSESPSSYHGRGLL